MYKNCVYLVNMNVRFKMRTKQGKFKTVSQENKRLFTYFILESVNINERNELLI